MNSRTKRTKKVTEKKYDQNIKKKEGRGSSRGAKIIKNENSPPPPVTPPPLFFFKILIVLLLDNFFSTLGSAIQFYQKFDFGGNIDFLGF